MFRADEFLESVREWNNLYWIMSRGSQRNQKSWVSNRLTICSQMATIDYQVRHDGWRHKWPAALHLNVLAIHVSYRTSTL